MTCCDCINYAVIIQLYIGVPKFKMRDVILLTSLLPDAATVYLHYLDSGSSLSSHVWNISNTICHRRFSETLSFVEKFYTDSLCGPINVFHSFIRNRSKRVIFI